MKAAGAQRFGVRRVYEEDESDRATYRVLVDRLWPRGVKKADLALDAWLKDVAPSSDLRRWYSHDVDRFAEFSRRYREELSQPPAREAVDGLLEIGSSRHVTLLTATRDVDHSGARVLCDHLHTVGT
ncbi:MAG: DUF488 family protein [Acidimicrobiia bacterium]|nr:DUF488 family protein [Acidimicrobiia bacterium]